MFELLLIMLTASAVLLVTFVKYRPDSETPNQPKPMCACGHHLCYHDGTCMHKMGHASCGCQKFIQEDTTLNTALYGDEL